MQVTSQNLSDSKVANKLTGPKTLQRKEGEIAYDDTGGSGLVVICLPGMGQLRSIYRFVTPGLRDAGYRVVTMDIRGMGNSTSRWSDYSESAIASDVVALVEQLQVKQVVIIGNSISAGAAVCASADHPDVVSGLVLVGPFVRQVPIPWWKVLAFRLAIAGPWGLGTWVNYQAQKLYPKSKPADLDEYNKALRNNLQESGRMDAFRRMATTDHRSSDARLDKVKTPVLVIMGGADPDFPNPEAEGKQIAQKLGGQLDLLPGLGHYPQAEEPDAFLNSMVKFLHNLQSHVSIHKSP